MPRRALGASPAPFFTYGQDPLTFDQVNAAISGAPIRIILFPAIGRHHCGAPNLRNFQELEGLADKDLLHIAVPGITAGIAERKVCEKETRYTAMLHHIHRRADDRGRDAVCFEMSGDQTHGLVTDRSKRAEDCRIRAVLAQSTRGATSSLVLRWL